MMTAGETTMAAAVMTMAAGETTMAAAVLTTMGPVLTTMGREQIIKAPVMTTVPAMAQVHLATIATQTQPAAISPPAMTALMGRVPAPQMMAQEGQRPMRLAGRKEQLPRAVVVRPMAHLSPIAAPGLGLTQRAGIKVLVPMGILVHLMVAAPRHRRTRPAAISPPARPTIKSRLLPLPVLPEVLKAPALLEIWGRRWTQPQRQQQQRQHLPWEAWLVLEANLLAWARWRPPAPLPPLRL
jgi:hypothetical protein